MKRVVSVSLGSSTRDHAVTTRMLGEEVVVQRTGTDGSKEKAIRLIRELDGTVDAFGLGGIDLYLFAGSRRYTIRDAKDIAAAAVKTPVVDGSGLKKTLEPRVVHYVHEHVLPLNGTRVLMTSVADRFSMADAFVACGADLVCGDLMFGLGLKLPVRSLDAARRLGRLLLPLTTQLPFTWMYPTGKEQDKRKPKWTEYFHWADVIAGDAHYIFRYMPDKLDGKVIITNTVTAENVEELRQRGVDTLVTTTPDLGGRSFGTNVMESLVVVFAGKRPEEMTSNDYEAWLDKLGLSPRIERLSKSP